MVFRFHTSRTHDDAWRPGQVATATCACVECALRAEREIEAGDIQVSSLGPYVVLEGFVNRKGDAERAVAIAEAIVGAGHVQSRILQR